jgi:Tol biopolymer transport system component
VWSPDGSEIIFTSDRDGPRNLYRTSSTGAERERLLLKGDSSMSTKDWSADGTQLLIAMRGDLWLLPLKGDGKLQPLVQGPGVESDGKLSPNGKWVAYVSNESGRIEVYLTAVASPNQRWQLSTTGGYQPRWSRDGREVYFVTADSRLMAVAITIAADVQVARPRELFRSRLSVPAKTPFVTRYDVSADGRFLLNVPIRPEPPVTVVLNWHAALRQPQ